MSGETILLEDIGDIKVASFVKANSRKNFAKRYIGEVKKSKKQTKITRSDVQAEEDDDEFEA